MKYVKNSNCLLSFDLKSSIITWCFSAVPWQGELRHQTHENLLVQNALEDPTPLMRHGKFSCTFHNLRHMASVSFLFGGLPVGLLGQVLAKHLGLLLAPAKDFSICNLLTKHQLSTLKGHLLAHYLKTLHWSRSHWLSVMLVALENKMI